SDRARSSERDFVREEIAAALRRPIVIIPIRIGSVGNIAALPDPQDLPDDIKSFVLHQKHDVTHERFGRDVADLISTIAARFPSTRTSESPQATSSTAASFVFESAPIYPTLSFSIVNNSDKRLQISNLRVFKVASIKDEHSQTRHLMGPRMTFDY